MVVIGGEHGSKVLWICTWPAISCFMLGYKEGSVWAAGLLCIIATAFFTPIFNLIGHYDYPAEFKLRLLSTYIICAAFACWLEYARSFYRNESHLRNIRLMEEHSNLKKEMEARIALEAQLKKAANTDSLTQIMNRGALWKAANNEWSDHSKINQSFSFAIIDIDNFKEINDKYGHPTGDEVIKHVVKICCQRIRSTDKIGRMGGEEFAIVMLNTNAVDVLNIAERIRYDIAHSPLVHNKKIIHCTISMGIYTAEKQQQSLEDIYRKADQALYLAKNAGRNQVKLWQSSIG